VLCVCVGTGELECATEPGVAMVDGLQDDVQRRRSATCTAAVKVVYESMIAVTVVGRMVAMT
jgi:hypothetical protein